MSTEYNTEVQKLFLEMMLHDAQNFVRVQNIYNSDNFDRSLRSAAEFIKKHSTEYKTLPTLDQITAITGVELDPGFAGRGHFRTNYGGECRAVGVGGSCAGVGADVIDYVC